MLKEYDDAHPSRDPSYEPKTKRVTLQVVIEIPDEGDDRDTLREAEAVLTRVLDEGNRRLRGRFLYVDYDLEALDLEDGDA